MRFDDVTVDPGADYEAGIEGVELQLAPGDLILALLDAELDRIPLADAAEGLAAPARGTVRFFGDEAEPVEKAIENAVAGLRVHISPRSAEIDALKRRLEGASNARGGEIILTAPLEGGREVEVKLPGRFTLDGAMRGALKTAPGVLYVEEL